MNTIFSIKSMQTTESGAQFSVEIDGSHRVFDGHFPNNPVLPGVVSLLMVRRCAEKMLGYESYFGSVKEIKYLQPIIPNGRPLTINLTCADKTVSGEIASADGELLMKMKGTLN